MLDSPHITCSTVSGTDSNSEELILFKLWHLPPVYCDFHT